MTEEDTVKLCVGLGQEHSEDVLWLLDTETVLAFWCESNMMATTHHLTLATVSPSEPIKLHVLPPKSRQVRDYVAMKGYPASPQ